MIKRIPAVLLLILPVLSLLAQEKVVTAGMKITSSTKIRKAVYALAAPSGLDQSLIVIEGNNITIDFNNAELRGSRIAQTPDSFAGVAILVRNGSNITIKNCKARGYRIALMARNVTRLVVQDCDFSYNYRKRLNSTQEKEDVSDWMSYHHNEKDEWLRYGAAIYLKGCNEARIANNKVTGGQNALMITSCNNATVISNDFSFNSGIGIGLYRSSGNRVINNRLVFNVRGYSHGIYNRGQDSAGILVYEQSSDNIFYGNNVTHGGDGFFLWAGQTTMDSGKGGCNDNLIMANDFSYAPTNGIEVTFSSNRIVQNRIFECDHGIWGGYSYNTTIEGNQFRYNRIAIAIEHGQHNAIVNNLFIRDREAIRLWARKEQPSDWGYAKNRDTRSVGYLIATNSFNGNNIVFNVARTDSVKLDNNTYSGYEMVFKTDDVLKNIDSSGDWDLIAGSRRKIDSIVIKEKFKPFEGSGRFAGRKHIRITNWGPYDFRSPIIWNINPADRSDTMKFELLGPKGNWIIKRAKGVKNISLSRGVFPAFVTATRIKDTITDIFIELEYRGEAIVTPFGETVAKGKPYNFSFRKYFMPLDWEVLFYDMDTMYYNPLKETGLFSPTARMAPFRTEKVNKVDYAWWGGIKVDTTLHRQFITIASAPLAIEPGMYELSVTWDDAVRIYLDDRLVLDEWNPSKYTFDESPHKKIPLHITGNHYLRVEHLELGGFATLSIKIGRKDHQ